MTTKDMKAIINGAKANLGGAEIVGDYFDSTGKLKGHCDGEPFEVIVPTKLHEVIPDPKNNPGKVEKVLVFNVASGIEILTKELRAAPPIPEKPKVKRTRKAKVATGIETATLETVDQEAN